MIHGVYVKASSLRVLQTASPFFTQNCVYTKSYGEKCEEQCLTALKSQNTGKTAFVFCTWNILASLKQSWDF